MQFLRFCILLLFFFFAFLCVFFIGFTFAVQPRFFYSCNWFCRFFIGVAKGLYKAAILIDWRLYFFCLT